MKQVNVKKLVLLNLPYFLLGLFATNLGEAWRLATGADASATSIDQKSQTKGIGNEVRQRTPKNL